MKFRAIIAFFWKHIKPYRWFYFLMMIAPIVTSFYPFCYNYAIKLIIDTMDVLEEEFTYATVLYPIMLFLGAQLAMDVVWRISDYAQLKAEPFVQRSILLESYNYVQHHSYSFFQDRTTGSLSSKLKGIVDGYGDLWKELHYGSFLKILKIIINLTALFLVNFYLGGFILLWSIFYFPFFYTLTKKLNKLSFEETESKHALVGHFSDQLLNMHSIFSFSARRKEYKSLDQKITKGVIPRQKKKYLYNFKMQVLGGILYLLMFTFTLLYTLSLKSKGLVTTGDFTFIFGITLIIAEDIWHLTTSFQDLAKKFGDLKSALSIIHQQQEHKDPETFAKLKVVSSKIEIKDLSFKFAQDAQPIFQNLNLVIEPGEKIGIVGHSGAGKSTLISLLLRYFPSNGGQILISGQDINKVNVDSLRENIAVIPQDTSLFHRTIMENIRFAKPDATDEEVIEACKKAHVHKFITRLPLGYNNLVGERGLKLSGGQRQRIAIARAILKNAPILILDEATSALDTQTERLIQDSLNFFISNQQKTVIAIAHRLSTLNHMDRILVMDQGSIIEQGNHKTLLRNKKTAYYKLWKMQEIATVASDEEPTDDCNVANQNHDDGTL